MARSMQLTSNAKMPKKADAAKIAAAKNAAIADAKAKAKPVAVKAPIDTVRDGITLTERQAKLFDALLSGPITRPDAAELLYGKSGRNRTGESGHAIYALARPLSGASSEGSRGKGRLTNFVLECGRTGSIQNYRLVKRPVAKKNGNGNGKKATSTGK